MNSDINSYANNIDMVSDEYMEILDKMINLIENDISEDILADFAMFNLLIYIKTLFLQMMANPLKYDIIAIPIPIYSIKYGIHDISILHTVQAFMTAYGYQAIHPSLDEYDSFCLYKDMKCYIFKKQYCVHNLAIVDLLIQHSMYLYYGKYFTDYIVSKFNHIHSDGKIEVYLGTSVSIINNYCASIGIDTRISNDELVNIMSKSIESIYKLTYGKYNIDFSYSDVGDKFRIIIIDVEAQAKKEMKAIGEMNKRNILYDTDSFMLRTRSEMLKDIISASESLYNRSLHYIYGDASKDNMNELVEYRVFTGIVESYPEDYLFAIYTKLNNSGELAKICSAYGVEIFANLDKNISDKLCILRVKISANPSMEL